MMHCEMNPGDFQFPRKLFPTCMIKFENKSSRKIFRCHPSGLQWRTFDQSRTRKILSVLFVTRLDKIPTIFSSPKGFSPTKTKVEHLKFLVTIVEKVWKSWAKKPLCPNLCFSVVVDITTTIFEGYFNLQLNVNKYPFELSISLKNQWFSFNHEKFYRLICKRPM